MIAFDDWLAKEYEDGVSVDRWVQHGVCARLYPWGKTKREAIDAAMALDKDAS